jgi:chromate transporter
MSVWLLYLLLLRATVGSFSGFASVPLVREDLVERRKILTDQQLNAALAISQASPGPLGLYVVVVGYFVGGVSGAVAGMVALATPAVLAIPVLWTMRRGTAGRIRGASGGIVIASSVLMLITSARLASDAAPDVLLAILVIAGFAALATGRLSPVLVVVLSAAIGVIAG